MAQSNDMTVATILDLVTKGKMVALASGMQEDKSNVVEADRLAFGACGYLNAATVLINAYPELNGMLENPEFLSLKLWVQGRRRFGCAA